MAQFHAVFVSYQYCVNGVVVVSVMFAKSSSISMCKLKHGSVHYNRLLMLSKTMRLITRRNIPNQKQGLRMVSKFLNIVVLHFAKDIQNTMCC